MIGGNGDHDALLANRAGQLGGQEVADFAAARSPTRPTTMMSASAPAIIWPISTDLPTPRTGGDRAMRCPTPAVSSELIARTPHVERLA